jgi:addiction module HigA family antidote
MARLTSEGIKRDYVPPPGETLQEVLESKNMTQRELADRMGCTSKFVNELIKGKAPISQTTALYLERVLGYEAALWNGLESSYREFLSRQEEEDRFKAHVEWLNNFPVIQMQKLSYLPTTKDKGQLVQALLEFLGIRSPEQWEPVW